MGRGEETILWPIVFLSANTKEQSLGRIMLRRNCAESHILAFFVLLVFHGIWLWKFIFHLYFTLRIRTFLTSKALLTINKDDSIPDVSVAYVGCHLKIREGWNRTGTETQPPSHEVRCISTPACYIYLMHYTVVTFSVLFTSLLVPLHKFALWYLEK